MPVALYNQRKEFTMRMNRKGFTLVEIMIVVAIIGILAAIAIPNFLTSRKESQKNACIANMKQIEGAVEQAKLGGATSVSSATLFGTAAYIKVAPKCPYNKTAYTTFDPVACPNVGTVTDHVLPN